MIGFNMNLADELAINLSFASDTVIMEMIRRITEELEGSPNEEVSQVWEEYRMLLREIGSRIHELLYKISVDKSIDPDVDETVQADQGKRSSH